MDKVSLGEFADFHRIELHQKTEGVYIFIFANESSPYPEKDYLADDMQIAIEICDDDYGIPRDGWRDLPYSNVKNN